MIGNNACGPHAVAYGRTADNVRALTVVDGQGRLIRTADGPQRVPKLGALVDAHLDVLRTEFGRFPRQISGYSLEHLLPERGRDLAKALVGSEGTLALTLDATIGLVPISPARLLVVLGYPDMASAADAVPAVLAHAPLAVEGLDARLVDVVRIAKGSAAVPDLPHGAGWLMVEVGGTNPAEARSSALSMVRDAAALDHAVLEPGPAATALWQIRADGAGLAGRTPDGRQAWPGWEDAAVPPARLGAYLREFEALMASYGVVGLPYGHFGDGCIHVRIDLPLDHDAEVFRRFVVDAARLVVAHGGSCSGEHGDGRARSELLSMMYSDRARQLFADVKAVFDPRDLLNPGVLVRPDPIDAHLRRPQAKSLLATDGFSFSRDAGDFTTAVHRCVGVGSCRADTGAAGGFMCPSYLASGDEKDVTRGRARVLQELTNGALIADWTSAEVHESLDLCLSCKACASDCPAGVDMAQYKSEVLHRSYRHRIRPVGHYSMGWLPRWISVIGALPGFVPSVINRLLSLRPLSRVLLPLAGIDSRRRAPTFAAVGFRRQRRRMLTGSAAGDDRPPVLLWADSFTDGLSPEVARAAERVLGSAGYRVIVPEDEACCGLTWITTGPAHGRPQAAAAPDRRAGTLCGEGDSDRRPGAVLLRRAPLRPGRADSRRSARGPGRPRGDDDGGTAGQDERLAAARPVGHPDHRPAALSPARGDGLRRRPRAARAKRRRGHRSRRMLWPGREFRDGEGPLRDVARGCGERPAAGPARAGERAPSCWPTDSPAGCRWISWRECGGSACPSCSRRTCRSTHRSSTDPQHRLHRSSGSSVPVR